MPPMGTGYADTTGEVTEKLLKHYVDRSRDLGLLIVEHSYVAPQGRGHGEAAEALRRQVEGLGLAHSRAFKRSAPGESGPESAWDIFQRPDPRVDKARGDGP